MQYIKSYFSYIWSLIFILSSLTFFSQEKSTNIQTINGKKYFIHKVEKGQSLYAISKLYNVDINVILADNDDAIDGINAGQDLKISVSAVGAVATKTTTPVSSTSNPTSTLSVIDTNRYVYHKVAKRETIYAIVKKYNLTEKKLAEMNPEISNGIKSGQMLIVAVKQLAITTNSTANQPKKDTLIPRIKKTKYNVGLFLPFKLNELESIDVGALTQAKANFPAIQSLATDFYLGFKRAADSLKSTDFEINLLLYDVDDKDSAKIEATCHAAEFKTLDLIVGPFYTSGYKVVANYAKGMAIPIVAPVTQQNKILFKNVFTSKVNPSQYTLLESMAEYCVDSLKNNTATFIINNASPKEVQYVKAFKQRYNEHLKELNLPAKDSVREVKGLGGFKSAYVPGIKNVVVLLSSNQVYLTDFVTQLAVFSEKKDILMAGWQSVTAHESIDQDFLNRLNFTFPSQNNLNNIKAYSPLIKEYQQSMSSDPGDYYFQGFDIAQYYLNNLKAIGPDFVYQLDKLPFEANFTRFKFFHPDAATGFENKGIYIFRYSNFQLYQTGWK